MKSKPYSRKRFLEKLEERVLFDASPDGNLHATSCAFEGPATPMAMDACPTSTAASSLQQTVNLVFIASNADNVNARLNEVLNARPDKSFQVYWLAAGSDSVAEVGQILESTQGEPIESVWFLLNDQEGLSTSSENAENNWWASQPGAVAGWSAHLSADTELVLPGVENTELMEQLERLTGATVLRQDSPTRHWQNQLVESQEIVFVDTSVSNYQALLTELLSQRCAEVVLLDGTSDGVLQMAAALEGRTGLTAIHLISHGSEGILNLGTATLDSVSMQSNYLNALTRIGGSLDGDGDFLIYGCNFTSGTQGLSAAMILGGIMEADIASSKDVTGHASLGGNWILETQIGNIQTNSLFASGWESVLAPPVVNVPAAQVTLEDVNVTFSGANLISVNSDVSTTLNITLSVSNGRLNLSSITGLTFLNGTSNGTASLQFSGSIANLNAALAGMVYTPTLNYFGIDTLSISVSDGSTTTNRSVAVSIVSQNDVPLIVVNPVNAAGTGTPSETVPHTFTLVDFQAVDPDNTNNQLTFVLNSLPTVGELRLGGFPVAIGTIFTQAQLASGALQYVHNGGEIHTDSFTLSVNDGAGGTQGPVAIPIRITPVNDPMTVSTQVVVYEGGSTNDPAPAPGKPTPMFQLSISDAEADSKSVRITSLPAGGTLRFNGTTITAFQISSGFTINANQFHLLEFIHNGVDDLGTQPSNRSFNITVFDNGGGTGSIQYINRTVNIQVVSVNDELSLVALDGSVNFVAAGTFYTLGLADMQVSDPDGPSGQITYTLENTPTRGILRINGQAVSAGASFTQAQLAAGLVRFHHNGIGLESLQFTARDRSISILTDQLGALRVGNHTTPLRVLTLNFDFEALPPGGNGNIEIQLNEQGTHPFSNFTTGDSITLNSQPAHGQFLLNGSTIGLGSSFVLAAGDVLTYQHSGVHVDTDHFQLTVNGTPRTVDVTVFLHNDPPQLTILMPLTTVHEGQTQVINTGWLQATDEETPIPSQLTYTLVGSPANGQVLLNGVALGNYATFTHQDVIDGRLSYQHNGGELFLDQIRLSLSDGASSVVRNLNVQVIPVNDQPGINSNFLQLFEGELKPFSNSNLSVFDIDGVGSDLPISPDSPLQIRIDSLPVHGTLRYNDPVLGMITVSTGFVFNSSNIERLHYQHNSSENFVDSFNFTVIDNNTYGTPHDASGTRSGIMNLGIIPVNDPPAVTINTGLVNDINGDRRVYEGGVRVLTPSVLFSGDPDSSNEQVQYRITSATINGQILLNGVAIGVGSAFTQNDLIAGRVSYRHNGTETTTDQFTFRIDDAASNVPPTVFNIGIIPVNDAPTIQAPANATVNTADYQFIGPRTISISDFDAASGNMRVTLTVSDTFGQLRVTTSTGLTVSGTNTNALTLAGSLTNLNAALATLRYRATDLNGPATLTVHVTDQGNTGLDPSQVPVGQIPGLINTGGINFEEAIHVVNLLVSPINNAPTVTVPGAQTILEDTTRVFNAANGNLISIGDADHFGQNMQVTLSVNNGTMSLSQVSGLTFTTGTGTNNATITFSGTQANINAAINGLIFNGGANFNGSSTLTMTTSDLGNTGDGGPQVVARTIPITVQAVNDAPTVAVGTGVVLINGATAVPGFVINDVDYTDGGNPASTSGESDFLQATIRILPATGTTPITATQHANVRFATTTAGHGATIDSTFNGIGSALVIRGTRAQVNAYLAGLTVNFTGTMANADQRFNVQVVADDRLRVLGTGALDGSGRANGGQNSNGSGGVVNVPTTVLTPYVAIPAGLTLNVTSGVRNVLASGINNAPLFSGMTTSPTFTEGAGLATGTPVVLAPTGALADPELAALNNWQNSVLTVNRLGGSNSQDVFGVTGSGNTGINFSGANIRSGTTVLGTFTNLNGQLTITFTAANLTTAQVTTVLRAITYANNSQVPPTTVPIQFTISDGDTNPDRIANPQGTGTALTAQATINVNIVPRNDAPTITGITAVNYFEDSGAIVLAPSAVPLDHELATFNGGNGNWGNASLTIARQGGANSQDFFNSSGTLSSLTQGSTLTLGGVTVGSVATNSAGTLSITFASGTTTAQVQQVMRLISYFNPQQTQSGGQTQNISLQWSLNDGDTDPDRVANPQGTGGALIGTSLQTVSLRGVNDAPAGTDFVRTINQDNAYTFVASDFGFSDPIDVPGNSLLNVIISTLPTQGTLRLNGIGVAIGQSIAVTDINAGRLVWTPVAGQGGPNYASLTFRVQDNGGSANGGVDTDPTPNTAIFHVNRAPQVVSPIPNQSSLDRETISLNVSGFFSDPEGHSINYSALGLPQGLSINPTTGLIGGIINSSASVNDPYSVVVTATDSLGAARSQTFTWGVTNPLPTASHDPNTTDENTSIGGNVLTNDTDPDNDVLTVIAINGLAFNVGSAVAGNNGGSFVINSNGNYLFNPGTVFDNLAFGETRVTNVNYRMRDADGATSTATVTITVTGLNDDPISMPIPNQSHNDADSINLNVAGFFSDPDSSDVLTFGDGGSLPPGLSIDLNTGIISGIIDPSASVTGPYTVTITATDPQGATTSRTFTWNIANLAPDANDDNNTTNENATVGGNVLTNDPDPDGDTRTVSHVNGATGNIGSAVTGSHGGTFEIQSNGSYTFDTGTAFNDLAFGEIRTTSVTYIMSDGEGGTSTATVVITVTGLNDDPVSIQIPDQNHNDGDSINLDVFGFFSDPDSSDVLIFGDGGSLPTGLSIHPNSGIISGTLDSSASVSGTYAVTITATDSHGRTTAQTFIWIVANPAPTATNNANSTSENASVNGNVLNDDTDPDGDALTVIHVNGVAGNVGNSITGSNGGSFVIANDGSYTFAPGTDFNNLAVGQSRTTTVNYTISDGEGGTSTATLTITVAGTNDLPIAVDDTYSTDQISLLNADTSPAILGQDNDVDGTFSVTQINGTSFTTGDSITLPSGALLTINSDGTFAYDPNGQFDYLGSSQQATDSFQYTITDDQGASSTATVTITIQGLDDSPVLIGMQDGPVTGTDGSVFESDLSNGTNAAGTGNIHSGTFTFLAGDSLSSFTINGIAIISTPTPTSPITIMGDYGTLTLTNYDPATGQVSYYYELVSNAPHAGLVTDNFAILIEDVDGDQFTGTLAVAVIDDAPIADNDANSVTEDSVLTANGSVLANDFPGADATMAPVSGVSFGATAGTIGSGLAGSFGILTLNANGTYSYSLDNTNPAVQGLSSTESLTEVFTYQITDTDGDTTTATLTITILGTNDTPVSTPIADLFNEDADGVNLDLSSHFSDADSTDTLTFSLGSSLPPGLNLNSSTGIVSGTIDSSASLTVPYFVTIVATDPDGATTSRTFIWHVANPAPFADQDAETTTENASVSGTVFTNDTDPDGDALMVTLVNGTGGNVGAAITGTNGGSFVVHGNGSFTFDPGTNFNDLASGESRITSVTYTISDGEGGISTATIRIMVDGLNDAPISTQITDQSNVDSDSVSLDVSGFFTDPDSSDVLTFSDGGTLPPGLSINPNTGMISGMIDSSASVSGPYTVVIMADDGNGGTITQTFTWNVTNPVPVAVDDNFGIDGAAPSTVIGNALDSDSDPDGDGLSVVPQTNIIGSNGGIFSIAADGSITFDPNGDFDHIHVTDSLTTTLQYTLIDADGATSTATISITVIGTNNTPIAFDDHYDLLGPNVSGNAFTNDIDPNGHGLSGSTTVRPQHGTLIWQTNGTFIYTPGPTFVDSDQFTYVVRDIFGASSTAVVHITRPFAWDSIRNESIQSLFGGMGGIWGVEQLVSWQLESLGSQPILAGYATPGAILKGRVYDLSGAMLAESTTQVNAAGNWVMNFYQTINSRNVIVIIDHVATEDVLLGDLHHFRLTDDTYRSLQLGAEHTRVMTPGTILSDRPSLVLEQMHRQNLNPLALL